MSVNLDRLASALGELHDSLRELGVDPSAVRLVSPLEDHAKLASLLFPGLGAMLTVRGYKNGDGTGALRLGGVQLDTGPPATARGTLLYMKSFEPQFMEGTR